ncbi:MAG: amidohydrolase [Actinomycetales bacterium]|nr:amidohydrolase [Actinomycetales bacterium]
MTAVNLDLLIAEASVVLTCNEQEQVLTNVSIGIRDGRIAHIGDVLPADRVLQARGHLLMPGLVNLHTHLAMTLLRGIAENVDLQGFLALVWAEEARVMNEGGVEVGTRLGAVEALLSGTTTTLDMYFHPDAAHRGAVDVGLRHVTGPLFFDFPGPDGMEWPQRMAYARAWPQVLADLGGPWVPPALMPHSPLTVGPDRLRDVAQLARDMGGVLHTHASENHTENLQTQEKFGARPIALLQAAGLVGSGTVIAHGVHLDEADIATLAAGASSIAHCPGSNLKLASGAADIVNYYNAGLCVGIGTDGCASSNDLDMFAAMRLAANLARLVRQDPAAISAARVLQAATRGGAQALGMADRIGSVEIGKEADLVLLDLAAPHLTPMRDPATAVVFSAGRSDVRHVIVAGEVVVANRIPTRVDLAEVIEQARSVTA